MPPKPRMELRVLLRRSKIALGLTQATFGPALGASHRTAQRWEAGRAHPGSVALARLAKILAPIDLHLAAEAAAHAGETLEELGLVAAPRRLADSPRDAVDIVVCAVAEHADLSPRVVRSMLAVAFHRLADVGLSLEAARQVLPVPVPAPGAGAKGPSDGA